MKGTKKFFTLAICMFIVIGSIIASNAYNAKFAFNLTSGWWSSWAYSSYVYKVTASENPVVTATYTNNNQMEFTYDVTNSNNESRVTPFSKTGTFGVTAFSRNTTQQNYQYRLRVKRNSGSWNSSASVEGLWNIDSY